MGNESDFLFFRDLNPWGSITAEILNPNMMKLSRSQSRSKDTGLFKIMHIVYCKK
ncbi:hypothetical protein B879_03664 [Cecembia lonarensis LW9]|uniref:Uncharacterized protein n=1 Tax=Cecembia lonarensis (strain CCUG 58316 / KCTC 22772 / LW9) TaxID=1225176 RepID=K1LUF2_CECL9|nr:hypothetical protein B879_03664 [Cecembia lonarensis LW9]